MPEYVPDAWFGLIVRVAPTLKSSFLLLVNAGVTPALCVKFPNGIAAPGPVKTSPTLKEIDAAAFLSPCAEKLADSGVPLNMDPLADEMTDEGDRVILSPDGITKTVAKSISFLSRKFTGAAYTVCTTHKKTRQKAIAYLFI